MSTKSEDMSIGQIEIDNRWTWVSMIDRLANGDITKYDLIYKKNYIECLTVLSYWSERDRYLEQKNEAINRGRR